MRVMAISRLRATYFFLEGGWKLLHSVGIGGIVLKDWLRLVQVLNP